MLGIFLDIETTGLDPVKHRPIDLAFKVVNLSNGELKASFQSVVKQPLGEWEKRDPESIAVNGYNWDEVQMGTEISSIREEVIRIFDEQQIKRGKAVFICQNPAFDRAFFLQFVDIYTQEKLQWPYHWLDLASMYWALLLKKGTCPREINLSKNAIAEQYDLKPEGRPHHAMNGVDHLIQCYDAVIKD